MLFAYPADRLRPILHGYFILSFLLLSLLGDQCLKLHHRRSLLRNLQIPPARMTGFLSGFSFLTSTWELRALPGGAILALLMLIVTVLTPLNTLIISAFVKDVSISSRCTFPSGMVSLPSGPFIFTGPPANGRPKLVASDAQIVSVQNGGVQGIYRKVNAAANFQAQAQDVFASWTCTDVNDDLTFAPATRPADIEAELMSKSYQYNNASSISQGASQNFSHLVFWSASATFSPFDIKASISLNALPTENMVVRSFQCGIAGNAADAVLSSLDTDWCMSDWIQGFQGGCYEGSGTPAIEGVSTFVEQYLNAMVMVQAGNNNLLQKPLAAGDATQGCVVTRASVPLEIFVLVGVVGVMVLGTGMAWLVLLLVWHCGGQKGKKGRGRVEDVPISLTGWMLHAARESAMGGVSGDTGVEVEEAKDLRGWRFRVVDNGAGSVKAKLVHQSSRGEHLLRSLSG